MRTPKALLLLLANAALAAGLMLAAGCFTSPTSPNVLGTSTCGGSCGVGGGTLSPTPTPITGGGGGGTGSGSISGTISGSSGGTVTVTAVLSGTSFYQTTRTGNGTYTVSGLPDGIYYVGADENTLSGAYLGTVTISGGNAVTGINITLN
ncbi:MAG: hypothetical protein AB1439_12690 [candidate division FCPU426 bacterium]